MFSIGFDCNIWSDNRRKVHLRATSNEQSPDSWLQCSTLLSSVYFPGRVSDRTPPAQVNPASHFLHTDTSIYNNLYCLWSIYNTFCSTWIIHDSRISLMDCKTSGLLRFKFCTHVSSLLNIVTVKDGAGEDFFNCLFKRKLKFFRLEIRSDWEVCPRSKTD